MVELPQAANTEDNNDEGGFKVVPAGEYIVQLAKAELRDAKSNPNNKYISMQFKVIEGEYAGQSVFEIINVVNSNPIAVNIGRQTMNRISKAANLTNVEDTDELLGIPIGIEVVVEEGTGDNPDRSKIKRYFNADGEDFKAPWD